MCKVMSRELGTTQEWNDERGGASVTRVSAQVLRVDLRDYLSEALGHILVDLLFVLVLGYGVAGVAAATLLSEGMKLAALVAVVTALVIAGFPLVA